MKQITLTNYLALAAAVTAWCILHSALISATVTEYMEKRLGTYFRYYRLFFNVVSIFALIPAVLFVHALRTEPLLRWDGYARAVQILLAGAAIALFVLGARNYDARWFLGFAQIREGTRRRGITGTGALNTSGILGVVRHPWYLATILIIWARPLDVSAIVVNLILTCYVLIGARLEERKLVRTFGEEYRAYQRKVSMLVPVKWITSRRGGK